MKVSGTSANDIGNGVFRRGRWLEAQWAGKQVGAKNWIESFSLTHTLATLLMGFVGAILQLSLGMSGTVRGKPQRIDWTPPNSGFAHLPWCSDTYPSFPISSRMLVRYLEIASSDTLHDPVPHSDSMLVESGRHESNLCLSRKGCSQIARLMLLSNLV